jgi:hypothetical protein
MLIRLLIAKDRPRHRVMGFSTSFPVRCRTKHRKQKAGPDGARLCFIRVV